MLNSIIVVVKLSMVAVLIVAITVACDYTGMPPLDGTDRKPDSKPALADRPAAETNATPNLSPTPTTSAPPGASVDQYDSDGVDPAQQGSTNSSTAPDGADTGDDEVNDPVRKLKDYNYTKEYAPIEIPWGP